MKKIEIENFILTSGEYSIPATVPGDISADLFKAGIIPDPFYADNFKRLGWIHNRQWTYSAVFSAEELLSFPVCELTFEGVDVFSEIYLNGQFLGKTDNAFKKYVFSVKDLLKKQNVLTVKMLSTYEEIEKMKKTDVIGLFNEKRFYVRKMQCSFGWDWAPDFIGYGLCGKVYLRGKNSAFIRNVRVCCKNSGEVTFSVDVNTDEQFTVRINTDGKTTEHKGIVGRAVITRKIENPLLWYPNGYGEPNLYAYDVKILVDGKETDQMGGVFAFREIETVQREQSDGRISFGFSVNGTEIFAKGSNFVPVTNLSGTVTETDYERLLTFAKQANYNMIRVWGGGIYEKEEFYSLCDRCGIIVWQDFMFSCSEGSAEAEFEKKVVEEAVYQIERLSSHPSVCVWCGGNELWGGGEQKERLFKVVLKELCEKMASHCVYLFNSPFSLENKDVWDGSTGDNHVSCFEQALLEDNVKNFRDYIYKNKSNFYTECTILGSCRIRSLKKFLPDDKLWPTNELWDEHFVTNPYGLNPQETFVIKEKRLAESLYGDISTLESFVKKSQLAQSDILRAEIDFARGNSDSIKGHLNWMYNDIWGCGTWSVVDKYFECKPAYFAQKRAFAPFVLNYTKEQEGYFANVVNDTEHCYKDTLKINVKSFSGRVLWSYEKEVSVEPFRTVKVFIGEEIPKGDYLILQFEEYKAIYLPDDQSAMQFETDISVKKRRIDEKTFKINVKANRFAKSVFIDVPCTVTDITDNYFDMEKDDEREITVTAYEEIAGGDIIIKTFADEWGD